MRLLWFSAIALAVALILVLSVVIPGRQPREESSSPFSQPLVLPHDMLVTKKIFYSRCGHTIVTTDRVSPELSGQPLDVVQDAYPGWSIERLDEHTLELRKTLDEMCPEDATYRLIKLSGDYVTVYWGRKPEIVKTVMRDIRTKSLSQTDRARLEAGITVIGDDEVARLLEGLAE